MSPVFGQMGRSFYIFVINLPWPLAHFFATMGNFWLLRILHEVGAGLATRDRKFSRRHTSAEAAEWLATAGPGLAQCTSGSGDLAYPESVRHRVNNFGMPEKIRLYRESVAFGAWEKSLETVIGLSELPVGKRASGAGLFEDGPRGSLAAPATIVVGQYDSAFDQRLTVVGIADYLTRGSQVLNVKGTHWLPHEEVGSRVIEKCAEWALGSEEASLKDQLAEPDNVKFLVEK